MNLFSKRNSEYSKVEKSILAFFAFVIFGFIGAIFRVFYAPISLASLNDIAFQFAPFVLGFAGLASVLAYFFPRVFSIILVLIPTNWS